MLGTKISLKNVTILPILSFTLSSYYLVNFVFYLQYFKYSTLLEFLLIGAPFIGRALTPLTYPLLVTRMSINRVVYYSLGSMGVIDIIEYFTNSSILLLLLRILTGVLFGLSTSAAVEIATQSKSKIIIGMTMGGWALGWLLAAFITFAIGKYTLIASSFSIIFLLFSKNSNANLRLPINARENRIAFSWEALLIFLLGFEPAYILQIVPSLLGEELAIKETIIAYSISFIAYLALPAIKNIRVISLVSSIIISITGFLAFITLKTWIFIPFTVFGLGFNSLLPIIVRLMGIEVRKIGPSMNLASLSGFLIPSLVSIGNIQANSALLTLLTSVTLGLIILSKSIKNANEY
ncbi:transporter [Sulfolobus tengchongensis]|uniref:Transporter n=1 Tax=Sulfolobus tengchongensis TaxID=207809 RepID=A0AAX4KYV8_9CREN